MQPEPGAANGLFRFKTFGLAYVIECGQVWSLSAGRVAIVLGRTQNGFARMVVRLTSSYAE